MGCDKICARSDRFHTIDFGNGIRSPGICPWEYLQDVLRCCRIPKHLDGKRVLDIGINDGFFAFEGERRGAAEIVAVDVHPIGGPFDLVLFFGVFSPASHYP
jgi:predicted methyltransferase